MEPSGLDPVPAAVLVIRVIEDIDHTSDEERDALLFKLLRAAWGSPGARRQ